jgi:hypothetical protein
MTSSIRVVGRQALAILVPALAASMLVLPSLGPSLADGGSAICAAQPEGEASLDTPLIIAAVLFLLLIAVVVAISIVRKAVRLLLVAAMAVIVLSACGCVVAVLWSNLS